VILRNDRDSREGRARRRRRRRRWRRRHWQGRGAGKGALIAGNSFSNSAQQQELRGPCLPCKHQRFDHGTRIIPSRPVWRILFLSRCLTDRQIQPLINVIIVRTGANRWDGKHEDSRAWRLSIRSTANPLKEKKEDNNVENSESRDAEIRQQRLVRGPCIISRNLISLGYYSIDQFVYLITIRYYSYSL
jgi:hypothetical protein